MADVIESATFGRWIRGLKDRAAVARINARLRNVSLGNMGDTRAVGDRLFEMRVHHGPGYRLYCLHDGDTVVVLCGGDKGSQRRDIERAVRPAAASAGDTSVESSQRRDIERAVRLARHWRRK